MSPVARTRTALAVSAAVHLGVLMAAVAVSRPVPVATAKPLLLHLLRVPGADGPRGDFELADARPAGRPRPGLPARVLAEPAGSGAPPLRHPLALSAPLTRGVGAETLATPAERKSAPAGDTETPGGGSPGLAAAEGVAGALVPSAGSGGVGGGGASLLGELHRRLAEAAVRCYPGAARRLRLQGIVPVRFCLDRHGVASALNLVGTSGSELLDRSALDCVVPGAEPLAGLPGCFEVPVRFGG
jgi:TonB family protein